MLDNVGPMVSVFRAAHGYLSAYIADPHTGNIVVSNSDSDKEGSDYILYGEKQNYDARTRVWYKGALKTQGIYVSEPYMDQATGLPTFTYSMAIYKNGILVGVLAFDVLTSKLQTMFDELPGRIFSFDENGTVFVSSDHKLLNPNNDELQNLKMIFEGSRNHKDYEPFYYTNVAGDERYVVCAKTGLNTSCVGESLAVINKPVVEIAWKQATIVSIIIVLNVIIMYFIISRMLTPLQFIQQGLLSFFKYI
ncbi:PDC sensor domain-containing protein, partial [Helicobacter sp. WB40]